MADASALFGSKNECFGFLAISTCACLLINIILKLSIVKKLEL